MQKFASSITRTIQQIEGEVRLEVPDLVLSDDMEYNLRNTELMSEIEEVCRGWNKQIQAALDAQQKKVPQGRGPLAEIDYWRERNASLSALYEQLKLPRVKQFLELFQHVDSSIEYFRQDLNKYYTEAKDNVRFLSTLERHLWRSKLTATVVSPSAAIINIMNICQSERFYNCLRHMHLYI